MKALQLVAFNEPMRIAEIPTPAVSSPDQAIVKVTACGICRTDWHLWRGDWTWGSIHLPLPFTLGHEMSGVVVETGAQVTGAKVGDRVIVPFHMADGTCAYCQAGRQNLCDDLRTLGTDWPGAFAEYVCVPNANLNCIPLPANVTDLAGAALGCRYMTAYHGVTARGQARQGQWFVVLGCGGVGLSAVQIANAAGAQVIAVDIDDQKLETAKKQGAVATLNARREKVPEAIKKLTGGGGAHTVLDANGTQETIQTGIMSLRKGGRQVQIGLTSQEEKGMVALPIDLIVQAEIEYVGSDGNPHANYAELLRLVENGTLKPDALVTRTVPLEETDAVMRSMSNYETRGYEILVF